MKAKYKNSFKYSSFTKETAHLKEIINRKEQIDYYRLLKNEVKILNSTKLILTIQELLDKYSNDLHEVYYQKKSHSLLIIGSMFVPIFHSLSKDAKRFGFTNITLESYRGKYDRFRN